MGRGGALQDDGGSLRARLSGQQLARRLYRDELARLTRAEHHLLGDLVTHLLRPLRVDFAHPRSYWEPRVRILLPHAVDSICATGGFRDALISAGLSPVRTVEQVLGDLLAQTSLSPDSERDPELFQDALAEARRAQRETRDGEFGWLVDNCELSRETIGEDRWSLAISCLTDLGPCDFEAISKCDRLSARGREKFFTSLWTNAHRDQAPVAHALADSLVAETS